MKTFAILTVMTACLSGCAAPTYTYDQIHSRGWTRESIDQRFPAGTPQATVLDKLGGPFAVKSAGDLSRWDYVGGVSGQQHVVFIFRNGLLAEKRYENF
ncbi:hypothetical protein RI103_05785 [Paraburkholderia sp. FT54]|uniref:hypothetical protein n=1 Tax=Paraburkholderia sp. FT54 TaxID=3074437 RepID=UPI0028773E2D|nr:hypothetical protein [Paraburkholderia sp. FT54]WNC90862.1 hypothetical protein RI103_05785 [Paraburkholderia sp. FT54]